MSQDKMRIGILTFHAQLNYGGVLQAFALQTALERAGYPVVIIDRWLSPTNILLRGDWRTGNWETRLNLLIRSCCLCGTLGTLIRHERTLRFVRKRLRLTPYHFYAWKEMEGRDLGVDLFVVGSDQVWNRSEWSDPLPYLLKDAPPIPAISYAASFGMRALPEAMIEDYTAGFKKFSAISVREAEGVQLVEACGAKATHVVDPTLLLDPEVWQNLATPSTRRRPLLVCYFLSEAIDAVLPQLEAFAAKHNCDVVVLCGGYGRAIPKTPKALIAHVRMLWHRWRSPVKLKNAADPQAFINFFAQATWVLSDSYHAMLFAAIFKKQLAFLIPTTAERQAMFARVEEFVHTFTTGPVLEKDLASALARFAAGTQMAYDEEAIKERREASWQWLQAALKVN